MQRIPEPELMDDAAQARAYAEAEFEEPNSAFVEEFGRRFPELPASGYLLDLGCGPGDISLRLARALPGWHIHGADGAPAMLDWAEQALARDPACQGRVEFLLARLPEAKLPQGNYDAVVSNSLLHHLHDPQVLWRVVRGYGASGAAVLVMDLARPDNQATARGIVERYAADEPPLLRRDFFNSLLAAFTPAEVEEQLQVAGLGELRVEMVSDRHLLVWGRLS